MKQLEDNIHKGDRDDKLSDNILGDGHSATENVIGAPKALLTRA